MAPALHPMGGMNADNAHGLSLRETYADDHGVNVARAERVASVLGGVALAAFGLSRGGVVAVLGVIAGAGLVYRGTTGYCHLYGALGLNTASRKEQGMARMERGASASVEIDRGIKVDERVVIERPAEEVYGFFRRLENLPRVMRHVERVEVSSSGLSHWTVRGPAGTSVEWDAEIINERPNEMLAWRSRAGGDVDNAGSVRFTPAAGGGATEVRVQLKYDPPAGRVGAAVAELFGESPEVQLREDLERLKGELEGAGRPA